MPAVAESTAAQRTHDTSQHSPAPFTSRKIPPTMSPAARRLLLAGAARRRRFSTDAAASDSSRPSQQLPKGKRWDAVVIGGGHNGLVAAAYLARAGRSVAVLERRGVLGGAAVSESDLVPGFRFSRCSYLLSLLRPAILR